MPFHHYFVWLEQVISANLDKLFPGMQVIEAHPFRVTRDADTAIQELEASDLLETMEQSVRQRRFGSVVRVTVNEDMPEQHPRDPGRKTWRWTATTFTPWKARSG